MSKAYENTMLTLTLTGAIFKILKSSFCVGANHEDIKLYNEVVDIYEEARVLTKKWPQQNNDKAIKNVIETTNTIIRNNKHLQGTSIFITSLTSIAIARLTDLYVKVKGERKVWIENLLKKVESFNEKMSANTSEEDLENQYEVGADVYKDLEKE